MKKVDIAREYVKRFPNSKKRTIAQLMYDECMSVFKDVEDARDFIRYATGAKGQKPRKKIPQEDIKIGKVGNPFELPPSEEPDWQVINIPEGNNRILLLSDIHVPYHSIDALTQAIEYGQQKNGVNTVILNGDCIDFYQASSFMKDPRKKRISEELDIFKDFLSKLYYSLGEPKIYFKVGNHEERLERYLYVKAPELIGVEEFKLNNLLEFGKYGIEYIDKKRIIKAGNLSILHGHEFGRSVFSPVNPARGAFMRAKESVIIGHHHQSSEHTEPTLNGKIITAWSTGCLCELNPEYMPINKWNHGFAYVETDGEDFKVHNKRIYKGKII